MWSKPCCDPKATLTRKGKHAIASQGGASRALSDLRALDTALPVGFCPDLIHVWTLEHAWIATHCPGRILHCTVCTSVTALHLKLSLARLLRINHVFAHVALHAYMLLDVTKYI